MNRNWSKFTCRQLISFRLPLTPVIQTGAKVMDRLFSMDRRQAD
jgi:hypothetical protein